MKIILLGLLVLVGCKTSPNPEFCCSSEADCAAFGVSELRSCGAGLTCDEHRCVRAKCGTDADCSPEHPLCSSGFCVDCDEAHACTATEPVCDLSTNTCEICSDHADCSSRPETPYCNGSACVQCLSSTQCSAATPFCDGGTCRECERDAECETHACGLDGRCVPEDQIVWLSSSSHNQGTCTRTDPCEYLDFLSTVLNDRHHVVMEPGVYPSAGYFDFPGLFIHGNGSVIIHAGNTQVPTMNLAGAGMVVRDLTISMTQTGQAALWVRGEGIVLDSITLAAGVKRLTVDNYLGSSYKASAIARNLKILNSIDSVAVDVASNGELTIDGGVISGGTVGIQGAPGAKVHLRNVMISRTTQRALELGSAVGDVESSTIADAGAATQAAPCAVTCNPNLRVTSSIIWQPSCAVGAADAAGPCTFQSSIVSNAPAPGITNVDPRFVNPAGGDYHLQPSSPAKDAVGTGPATDFEGDLRPRGAGFDIGADEAAP
jgi:hypothetical protein